MRRGASLVEVLVVVGIILVLAIVSTVVFLRSGERGRIAQCMSNLHQIDVALRNYAADFDDWAPASPGTLTPKLIAWKNAVLPYSDEEVFFCPSDRSAKNPDPKPSNNFGKSAISTYQSMRSDNGTHLSSLDKPAEKQNLVEYRAQDLDRCYEDEMGVYFLGYSPHENRTTVLYWDGHVTFEQHPWAEFQWRYSHKRCADFKWN
jgi:prepilin-type processing-associated H-X9-DG protein